MAVATESNRVKPDASQTVFNTFPRNYGNYYAKDDDQKYHFDVYRKNMKKPEELEKNGRKTSEYGVIPLRDFTEEELKDICDVLDVNQSSRKLLFPMTIISKLKKILKLFDWRTKNVVSYVDREGDGGACWDFTGTSSIEKSCDIKHKKLYKFSSQELINCDYGCKDGVLETGVDGLQTAKSYPYKMVLEHCKLNKKKIIYDMYGTMKIPSDEEKLVEWLEKNESFFADGSKAAEIHFYEKGIAFPKDTNCPDKDLKRVVLVVILEEEEEGTPNWIMKNSWEKLFKKHGYCTVYRGNNIYEIEVIPSSIVL